MKKGRASISPRRVTHSERAAARMTASFQHSHRDGQVTGLVFRQGCLAYALVIAAWINVIVSTQAGAEGLDAVLLERVIVSDNVLFHLHTTVLASLHTTKSAVFVVSPNTPPFSSLLCSQRAKRA